MEHIEFIVNKLEPGDVIFNRRLFRSVSAILFNGFWRHTGIFLGTPHAFSKKFDRDESVLAHYGAPFTKYLSHRYPKAYNHFEAVSCKNSSFIESNLPGVTISDFKKFIYAVSAAAIRPNLSNFEIALAIEEAFKHYGKGFNFFLSFENENRLTCTQLVYVAYRPNHNNKRGIKFTISKHYGVLTMAATELMGHFVKYPHDEKHPFTFVFFGKYRRKGKVFEFGSQRDFVDSHYLLREWPVTDRRAAFIDWLNVLIPKLTLVTPYRLLLFLLFRKPREKYMKADKNTTLS